MVLTILLMVVGFIGSPTFREIISKPDNVPIAAMLIIIQFVTWIAFKQSAQNDHNTRQGHREKIYEDMIR